MNQPTRAAADLSSSTHGQAALRPSPRAAMALFALALAALLPGCGGSDDISTAASPPAPAPVPVPVPPPPPPVASTTLEGAVVKGPVAGAAVCAFTVVAGGRGAALGSCTTSDATGAYALTVPAGSGALWIEATGGSYTDEATGAIATLPPGSPLRTLTTATGGIVRSVVTPLTTLALNDALARLAAGGTLDGAAFAAATTRLLATFGLPAGLAIGTATPTFGTGIDSYGTALTVVSRMVAAGTPLATLLATVDPTTLAAAYAAAAAPPPPPPPTGGSAPSASGSLALAGTLPTGSATSFAPDATAFIVTVSEGGTVYTFERGTSSAPGYQKLEVTVPPAGATTVGYTDLGGGRTNVWFCRTACGVTASTAPGTTRPVTLTFAATPLTSFSGGSSTLAGSLVGDAPGALFSPSELPRSTASSLTLNGSAVGVLTASDQTVGSGASANRVVTLNLADGSLVSINQPAGAAASVQRIVPPSTSHLCFTACNVTLSTTATGSRVVFANTALGSGPVLNGSVDIGSTSGSLTSTGLGGFTPISSSLTSSNDERSITFSVLGTPAQSGISLVTVQLKAGRVIKADAAVGIGSEVYGCLDNGASISVPPCTQVTVAADGRTVRFNDAVLYGGPAVGTKRSVTFTGTLVAKGL